ncbi:MAG: DUF86 domain-containing protein [Hadesarchaea archaeon]|nr:DUF86 domain-containing protein [Hadesarchaea archaeon]
MSDAARRIEDYIRSMTFEKFERDTKTQDAVVRNVEIVGEAVKLLSGGFKRRHPNVPWKQMAGMRDVIIHRYFGVALDIVWRVATKDLPEAVARLEEAEVVEAGGRTEGAGRESRGPGKP